MYKSRYHFSNGQVSVAVDSLSGVLLELVDVARGENLLKNHCYDLPQPFSLHLESDDKILYPPDSKQVKHNPALRCDIAGDETGFSVRYHWLTDGTENYPADVCYRVRFDGAATVWSIDVQNVSGLGTIREVCFPRLNGIWLGTDFADDTLVYPINAGVKWENPVAYLEKPTKTIQWRWQEYRYTYPIDGCCGWKCPEGTYRVRQIYPGDLSMSWLDLYDADGGLYFGSHDPDLRLTTMTAATFGTLRPGMHFSVSNDVWLTEGACWTSPDRVAAFHRGDWHDGARIYRAFKEPRLTARPHPAWFDKSAGLVAHYDFKYQNQEVVHMYKDIPTLREEARAMGLDHILLSGWHRHGFDNGFPLYHADEEMGTEEELAAGMKPEPDMHVSLYVNAWLANTAYADIEDGVSRNRDGSPQLRKFGDDSLTFGLMCPGAESWRNRMLNLAGHIEHDWGGGVYFDMLSAHPRFCYAEDHDHRPDEIGAAVKRMLSEAADGEICLMGEHVSDEYGGIVAGQLMQSFFKLLTGTYEEVYRYTLPEHILIDMLYPGQNLAMRPVFVAQGSDWLMHNHFVNGIYYWIYDLVDDNTFTRDPAGMEKLKGMIRLRKRWLEKFGRGIFLDTDGLTDIPDGVMARCYRVDDGYLLACAGELDGKSLGFAADKAVAYTVDSLDGLAVSVTDGRIALPAGEFAVLHVANG